MNQKIDRWQTYQLAHYCSCPYVYSQQESVFLVGLKIGQCKDVCKYIFLYYFSIFLCFCSSAPWTGSEVQLYFGDSSFHTRSGSTYLGSVSPVHVSSCLRIYFLTDNYWTFWVTGYIVEVMELWWFGLQWNKLVVWQQLNYCLQVSENTYRYYLRLNGDITISWVRLYSTTMFTCIIYALLLWDRWEKKIINTIFVPQTFNLFPVK